MARLVRQSERMALYDHALDRLDRLGVLYPCFCTRRRIRAEIAHASQAPHGPSGEALYPGICRTLDPDERAGGSAPASRSRCASTSAARSA